MAVLEDVVTLPVTETERLCECGCGRPTRVAPRTNTRKGYVKGQPIRFVSGHHGRLSVEDAIVRRMGRFWSKVDVRGPDECWPWTGCIESSGYGRFGWDAREVVRAHTALMRLLGVTVPKGHEPDHTCFVKRCCNPRHIEVVTGRLNRQRANHRRYAK